MIEFIRSVGFQPINDDQQQHNVPQSSTLGPLLFSLKVTSLMTVTRSLVAHHHQYADDTYLYIFANKDKWTAGIHTIEQWMYNWLLHNGLVLNPSKSKAIQFSCVQARHMKDVVNIHVAGTSIALSPSIKSLGVILDLHLTFDDHVAAVSKACYFHIRVLKHIRAFLPDNVAMMIAYSRISSRLDYCN